MVIPYVCATLARPAWKDFNFSLSEIAAFELLHIIPAQVICHEGDLTQRHKYAVPELVVCLDNARRVSVEVKRLCSVDIPRTTKEGQRVMRQYRGQPIWPWSSTVRSALGKCHNEIADEYDIKHHHIVFVFPNTMRTKHISRLQTLALRNIRRYRDQSSRNTTTHFIATDSAAFED